MTAPPPVTRPNGKLYRPRSIRVDYIDDDGNHPENYPAKTVVLGTHDIAIAQQRVSTGRACQYLISPRTAWLRLGFEGGELRWVHDEAHGAACVIFDESDDPPGMELS